jgi:hypothetical protein
MSEAIKPTGGKWFVVPYGRTGVGHIVCVLNSMHKVCADEPVGNDSADDALLIAEAGTVHHETGLTPRQLVERVKELEGALRMYEDVRDDMFSFFLSNGIFNQWGKRYDCSSLNNAHLQASAALSKSLPNTVVETPK